jgi:hypothetical protein
LGYEKKYVGDKHASKKHRPFLHQNFVTDKCSVFLIECFIPNLGKIHIISHYWRQHDHSQLPDAPFDIAKSTTQAFLWCTVRRWSINFRTNLCNCRIDHVDLTITLTKVSSCDVCLALADHLISRNSVSFLNPRNVFIRRPDLLLCVVVVSWREIGVHWMGV